MTTKRGRPTKDRHPTTKLAKALLAWMERDDLTQDTAALRLKVGQRTLRRWLDDEHQPPELVRDLLIEKLEGSEI